MTVSDFPHGMVDHIWRHGLFGGIAAFAGRKSSRPHNDSLKPRFISWPVVAILAAVFLVFAAIHALNLMGMQTSSRTLSGYGG